MLKMNFLLGYLCLLSCYVYAGADCVDTANNCAQLTAYCNNAVYYTLMTEKCPVTCGRCSGTGTGSGSGSYNGTGSGTGSGSGSGSGTSANTTCNNGATSCGVYSSTTNCVDKTTSIGTSNCQTVSYMCNVASYYDLMTFQCPKTCGRCGYASNYYNNGVVSAYPGSTNGYQAGQNGYYYPSGYPTGAYSNSGTCSDRTDASGSNNCAALAAQGYCTSNATGDLGTFQCPYTCGRCGQISGYYGNGQPAYPYGTSYTSNGVIYYPYYYYTPNTVIYYNSGTVYSYTGATTSLSSSYGYYSSTGACVDRTAADGTSNCAEAAAAGYCTLSTNYDLMTFECPRTCGRCGQPSNYYINGQTAYPYGQSYNTGYNLYYPKYYFTSGGNVYYTSVGLYYPYVTTGTGTGSVSGCVDLVGTDGTSNCQSMASYCNNAVYYDLMTQQCPATCGRCSVVYAG